jgi:hypothetical protein
MERVGPKGTSLFADAHARWIRHVADGGITPSEVLTFALGVAAAILLGSATGSAALLILMDTVAH